jgi:hypothetical protein
LARRVWNRGLPACLALQRELSQPLELSLFLSPLLLMVQRLPYLLGVKSSGDSTGFLVRPLSRERKLSQAIVQELLSVE